MANNLTGKRFGKLTALEPTEKRETRYVVWRCLCDCDNAVVVATSDLRSGHTKSCGCYWKAENCQGIGKRLHWVDGTCVERLNLQKPRSDNKSGHIEIHKVDENCYRTFIGFKGEQIHTDFLELYYRKQAESPSLNEKI